MFEKDDIQELVREKLQSHEVAPSDAVWNNVFNSLSNASVLSGAATSGTSLLLKVAAVVGVSSIGITAYFIFNGDEDSPKKESQTIVAPMVEPEGDESNNFDESIASDTAMEIRVKPISNKNISLSEGINPSENINSVATDGQGVLNEAPENIPKRNEDKMTSLVSILDASPEDSMNETSILDSPPPVSDAIEPDVRILETEEEPISENQKIQEEIQEPIEVEEVIVWPNIFTPNNDGANDFFEIQMREKLDFQIIVIDQKNKVVFQSNAVDFRWDGTLPEGDLAPSGNYIYYVTAKTVDGKDFFKNSDLRIER